jgi:spermidine synthase
MNDQRRRLALMLMMASGFAALGYQIVWTQQSALWLGHETAAVLAVVTAFFGGLALGALALGPRIDLSRRPSRWYAACEAVIGLWSIALAFLMAPVSQWLLLLTGAQPSAAWQWTVAFCGTFLLLLPATAAMGATLPAMERVLVRLRREGSSIAALYAANTFGAFIGVLSVAFWLVPQFGLARAAAICAALNLLCAALTLALFDDPTATTAPEPPGPPARAIPAMLAATGLLGIGYEVLVVRVLSQVTENTVYTFAMLLAVYLVGTALGASWYRRRFASSNSDNEQRGQLLWMTAATCLIGMATLWGAEDLKAMVARALGPGMAAALSAEAALAVAAFLPPTILMGALFSHLCTRARASGIEFGRTLGVNTLGAAAAPALFGVVLVPAVGPKFSLLMVVAGYLALAYQWSWRTPMAWVTAASAAALAVWAPPLAFVDADAGSRIVSYREGAMATVSVVEDADGVARLRINNRQQEGSSATLFADARQALLPLLLHPAPRHALFLGLGTGVTASSAAQDPLLVVDAVELLPEVIDASVYFRQKLEDGAPNPRLNVVTADARRFVRSSSRHYDVIVSDNFHPARSGSGSLYTVEHFRAVRDRLAPGGLFCQWLPLHQLDLDTLRSIVRAFVAVYPDGWALLATNSLETPVVGLVAFKDPTLLDVDAVRQRLADTATPLGLSGFGLDDELALLGSFIAGPRALARFAGNAPINTDDRPVVAYRAPRITYVPDATAGDRLIALLRELEISPDEVVMTAESAGWENRLAAYWTARNHFIEAGRGVQPTADVQRMLSKVREPLLSVLRTSPDFHPAYDPLLQMAIALGQVDAGAARALLIELRQIQPSRPEAAQALRELSGLPP